MRFGNIGPITSNHDRIKGWILQCWYITSEEEAADSQVRKSFAPTIWRCTSQTCQGGLFQTEEIFAMA